MANSEQLKSQTNLREVVRVLVSLGGRFIPVRLEAGGTGDVFKMGYTTMQFDSYIPLKGKRSYRFRRHWIALNNWNIFTTTKGGFCPHYTQALQICRLFCGNLIKNYLTNGDNGKFRTA